ncbi:MAG: PEP-utilizing enzyme [Acidimicrobiia bacterium]|nr:PEP-utilizing enzyme [Acidimicrobiia bacterium]MDH5288645.1 PEP-utilizing enzyme [Acidimicrobiia bacterium]
MTTAHTAPTWNPPGPGSWRAERSHGGPGVSRLYARILGTHTEPTYRQVFADFGGIVGSLDMQVVNGAIYRRIVPLVGADKDTGKVPSAPVLWLATRLHPEFRRRERTAQRVLAENSPLDQVKAWFASERDEWQEANREIQAIDPGALDDTALAAHLDRIDAHLVRGWCRHHQLHGSDLGPIGDMLAHATDWGLDQVAVMGLLKGASPATVDAARHGATIAVALRAGGVDPATVTSVDQLRAVPAAAAALDDYLDEFGWRVVSGYDVDSLTLHELPSAICTLVRRAAASPGDGTSPTPVDHHEAEAELRAASGDPALFDELLDSARQAYGLRDDNGPLTWEWPMGLARRAYLAAGDRLATRGRLHTPADVLELDLPELAAVLRGATAPTADETAARAEERRWQATLRPPEFLGAPMAEPDLGPLPPASRRMMRIILSATTLLDPDPERSATALSGLGIGSRTYQGRARVADDPNRAIQEMEPGDVLVAPWTAPSYNSVLAIAGGIVVQEGGLLCHAAVMARELDLPAVIGCTDAMAAIRSGDLVEIDPAAGTVTVLESVASH